MTRKPATGPGTTSDPNQSNKADPKRPERKEGRLERDQPRRTRTGKPGTTSDPNQVDGS